MDGDLQNEPEDIPQLVAAVEDGADVASGRRGRAPRLLGPDAAVAADQRDAAPLHRRRHLRLRLRLQRLPPRASSSRCCGAIGKQKFTKALVLSGGASVVEVDVAHAARAGSSRYSPLRLTRLALHVLAGFWPQPIQWIGDRARRRLHAARDGARHLRRLVLDRPLQLPRPAARRRRRALRARHPGLHPRARRGVPRQNPARRRRPASLHDRRRSCEQARSRHRRRRVHLVELHPPPAGAHRPRGRLARRAHLRGQPREPRRRDGARAALVRARRHPRRRSSCAKSSARST